MLKAKEKREGKEGKVRVGKGKDHKGKGVAAYCYTCGTPGHLARDCWGNNIPQVASDTDHASSGGAYSWPPTSQFKVSKVARRIPHQWSEELRTVRQSFFDLREGHDDAEDHGIGAIHFYIGDDSMVVSHMKKEKTTLRKTPWRLRMRSPRLEDSEKREMMWPSL